MDDRSSLILTTVLFKHFQCILIPDVIIQLITEQRSVLMISEHVLLASHRYLWLVFSFLTFHAMKGISYKHRRSMFHHEWSKVVKDVSQSDEDGRFSVKPPHGAVLLHQPLLLQQ